MTQEESLSIYPLGSPPTRAELEAFDRLIAVAESDTGQSRKCANFLLAWWNAGRNGGLDPTDLWGLDLELRDAAVSVFCLIARWHYYPTSLPGGRGERLRALVSQWRPEPSSTA